MKAAIVLSSDSGSMQQQAFEVNTLLNHTQMMFTRLELWVFYKDRPPECFPEIARPVSAVKLVEVKTPHLPESCLQHLDHLTAQYPMDLLLFTSGESGAELASRLAFRRNGSSCLRVQGCNLVSGKFEVIKPAYGNHLAARCVLESLPYCLSVAKQPRSSVKMARCDCSEIKTVSLDQTHPCWVKETLIIPDPPETGLADADLVVVIGQGADNLDTVKVVQAVADILGAELGASRPVVMNAWTDMNRLIGASGRIISPELCIAAGVSGTAVFSEGIKNSEFIVAINTDRNAPIFQMAHVGIVGDLKAVLSELGKVVALEKEKRRGRARIEPAIKSGIKSGTEPGIET